jgi:PTH2 family peptidyl-tRNA hydrolase
MGNEERPVKQVIVIRRDLGMRRGKEIAQGAHASMAWLTNRVKKKAVAEGYGDEWGIDSLARFSQAEWAWIDGNFRKVVVKVNSREELMAVYAKACVAGVIVELITDSGLTEFHGKPTSTCLAVGPDYDDVLDPITGDLALY